MTPPVTAADAASAVRVLASLPPLTDAGLSFTAVLPAPAGGFDAFGINLTTVAQQDISQIAETTRSQPQNATLIQYGPATLIPPQHCMHIPASDAANLTAIESAVRKQDILTFTGEAAASIKMLAASFTTEGGRRASFYRIADTLLQVRKNKWLGLVQQNGVYGRVEPTDMLLMRTDFEVVVVAGYAFFWKKATFERAFGFLDQLKAESLATFNAVTTSLKIDGIDELRKACTTQPQMMAKMSSIKRSMDADPEYAAAMTMPKLVNYVEEHPHVDIAIVGSGNDRRFVFNPSPARRFQLLKLLDDDFLHSVLTKRDYEAGSKQQTATE
ncbi:MAG: DUF4868 domain-containing protein [Mycolicibacterium rufum]|nr:DUF4868 domain-containing protein [Mycolicibacterium rufum]